MGGRGAPDREVRRLDVPVQKADGVDLTNRLQQLEGQPERRRRREALPWGLPSEHTRFFDFFLVFLVFF